MKRILLISILFTSLVSYSQADSASFRVRPNGTTSIKQYVNVPVTPSLQLGGDFTLECWVNVPSPSAQQEYLIETYGTGGGGYVLRLNWGNIMVYAMGASAPSALSTSTVTMNQWNHVAATFNDVTNEVKFYINGVLDNTATLNVDNYTTTTDLRIGARGDDMNVNDSLYMDEVRIWNVVRTENEIAANMSSCLVGNESGLVLYYDFEDLGATGSTVLDKTSNSNDGTIIGNVDPRADGAFMCCFVSNLVTQNGNTLSAMQPGAMYQWIDCGNGNNPINLANGQSYTPTTDGSYACIINNGACSDTSSCMNVTVAGINKIEKNMIEIFPNPATDKINIVAQNEIESVSIFDVHGNLIDTFSSNSYSLIDLDAGIYFITVKTTYGISQSKFVKQ